MLERKRILIKGPAPSNGPVNRHFDIDDAFVESLQRNLQDKVLDYVPVVAYNSHTWDPSQFRGEVKGIVVEGDEVYAELDYTRDITDLKPYDVYPMLHLNYRDTRTGEHVGPTLIHVLLKPRPVVPVETTTYRVSDSPKMLRETLCLAQSMISHSSINPYRRDVHIAVLQRLIDACDVHRPLGPDGKHSTRLAHGNLHTDTCGCEDKSRNMI